MKTYIYKLILVITILFFYSQAEGKSYEDKIFKYTLFYSSAELPGPIPTYSSYHYYARIDGFKDGYIGINERIEESIIVNNQKYYITSIADEAFKDCPQLDVFGITSPYMQSIGTNVFGGTTHLKELWLILYGNTKCPPFYIDADFVIIPQKTWNMYKQDRLWLKADIIEYGNNFDISKQKTIRNSKEKSIIYSNMKTIQRWEYSIDEGMTWIQVNSQKSYFIDENPQQGKCWYRILDKDGTYKDILKISYYNKISTGIQTIPMQSNKTVDESITFSLSIEDDGYYYQWYKNDIIISETQKGKNTFTIPIIKANDAGSYYCQISNSYDTQMSIPTTLSVQKASQNIDFPEITIKSYGDDSFSLPKKTDKGVDIYYQSSNTKVATIFKNTVTIVGVGSTNIIASGNGNADYLAAETVTRKLTVNKIRQTIIFNPLPTKMYGDSNFMLPEKTDKEFSISYQSINTDVATISGNIVTIKNAGTTDIIATQVGDSHHYAATPVTQTLIVKKALQNIYFPTIPVKTYGDAPIKLNQYSDKGLKITYASNNDVVLIKDNILTINKPGTAEITATQNGTNNYETTIKKQIITINKNVQIINWDNLPSKTMGDAPFSLPSKTNKNLVIFYTSDNENVATIKDNIVTLTGGGVANITASQAGDEYYKAAENITLQLVVLKGRQQITFLALPEYTYSEDLKITLKATAKSAITYESSNEKVATIEGDILTIHNAGESYITAKAEGDKSYYAADPIQQLLKVNKTKQTISLNAIEDKIYGDEPFTLFSKTETDIPVIYKSSNPTKLIISGNQAIIAGSGSFNITATQAGNDKYETATATQTVFIKKANLIVTAENKERYYGDINPDFTISYEGFVNGDSKNELNSVPSISCNTTNESNIGEYDITLNGGTAANYNFMYRKGILNIKKAPLLIKAKDCTKEYGEKVPQFILEYSGFKNQETSSELTELPSAISTVKAMSNIGIYDIFLSGGLATNYELKHQNGKLTITKAPLIVTANNITREYGEENPVLSISYSGFKGEDDESVFTQKPLISTEVTSQTNAGKYDIIIQEAEADNYSFKYKNGILEISKVSLIVIAEDNEFKAGEQFPQLSYSINGFKLDDTEEDLDELPIIYCNADENSPKGKYDIIVEAGFDNNYTYEYQNGILTIGSATFINGAGTNDLKVHLSPSKDKMYFITNSSIEKVDIISINGSLLYSKQDDNIKDISINELANGCYILRIWQNESNMYEIFKFIK